MQYVYVLVYMSLYIISISAFIPSLRQIPSNKQLGERHPNWYDGKELVIRNNYVMNIPSCTSFLLTIPSIFSIFSKTTLFSSSSSSTSTSPHHHPLPFPVRITVLGSGNFALALSSVMARNNFPVTMLCRNPTTAEYINEVRGCESMISFRLVICLTSFSLDLYWSSLLVVSLLARFAPRLSTTPIQPTVPI